MTALATIDDLTALGADPALVTEEMLEQASARFRSEAHHQITEQAYTFIMRPAGGLVKLTRVPVVSVDTVKMLNSDGTPGTALAGWTFDGIDLLDVNGITGDAWVNGPSSWSGNVEVTWTAGFDPVPEDVRWAVAAMVKRASEAGTSGVTSEQIGDYSRSFGGYSASGAYSLSKDERETAAKYRPRNTSMPVRLG
jgi:hypothetical protein